MLDRKSKTEREMAGPDAWAIDLHTERSGLFFYRYRRLHVERTGRRAAVREFAFSLDYDYDLRPVTKPRGLVRQRGRSLPVEECRQLWCAISGLHPERLLDSYLCLDDTDPSSLDCTVGPDGVPIAVSTGEEGPACLTLRSGRQREASPARRIVVDRYSGPSPLCSTKAPLASLIALLEPGLRDTQTFNYRRSRPLEDLMAEFQTLKALDFLNLGQFERRCLEALGSLGCPEALPFLTGELFASDPQVRLSALEALGAIGECSAAPDVELLYYDDVPAVRERAREVLGRLHGQVPAS